MNQDRREAIEKLNSKLTREFAGSESTMNAQLSSQTGLALVEALEDLHQGLPHSFAALRKDLDKSMKNLSSGINISVDKLIASNEKLAESNDRHSTRMLWLTIALLIAAAVEAAATAIQVWQR